ncbi:MAG TPA: hypothetical protein VL225_14785 [Vicinamibacterales bacterium]|nr:hypothetical protein [Vicinamibacterales bacterium]
MKTAAAADASRTPLAIEKARGSRVPTPKRMQASKRLVRSAMPAPAVSPIATGRRPSHSSRRIT